MAEQDFLRDAVVLLVAAAVFILAFHRLRASPVLGYLAAGILIGPHGLGLVGDVAGTRALAQLGVAFLLFSIGLELSFARLRLLRFHLFGLGSAQVLISSLVIGAVAVALGASLESAVVIGGGLALSSTAIVLQLLSERREIASRFGRISFSVLLLQDLAVVPLLAVVPALGAGPTTDWSALGLAAGTALLALAAIVIIGRLVLKPLYRIIAAARSSETFVLVTLTVVLGTGWAAGQAGLSITLGAFLAGLLLSETEFRHQVEADMQAFRGLLLGLFFITVGMFIDISLAVENAAAVAALLVALVAGKAALLWALCRMVGIANDLAARVGLILAQGGEFAFILIGAGAAVGVVPPTLAQYCLVVVSLSMALTPLLAVAGKAISNSIARRSGVGLAAIEQETDDLDLHVLIAGFGRVGRIVGDLLEARKIPYVAIDLDPANVREGRARGLSIFYGDASRPELLWGVGADRARMAVVTLDNPEAAARTVHVLRQKLPDLKILVRARDHADSDALTSAGATEVVPETLESSLQLAGTVLRSLDLPEEDIGRLLDEYRRNANGAKGGAAKPPQP